MDIENISAHKSENKSEFKIQDEVVKGDSENQIQDFFHHHDAYYP
jgi:hypothetical protein